MKCLVIGDLHCREIWGDIVDKEGDTCDKIIFLGDYTCPRDVKMKDPTDACGFLYEVLDYKEVNPDKVVLLRGNHDLSSLGYCWAECWPKDHPKVEAYWQTYDVKEWFLRNSQWVYIIPGTNIVCSHAGISEDFLKCCANILYSDSIPTNKLEIISEINRLPPSELFGFTPCKISDQSGESPTQPCTWIRPNALLHYGVKGVTHVVGHTSTNSICNLKDVLIQSRINNGIDAREEVVKKYCDIWCCDNLSNGEYLIIEDGEFKPCKL